MAVESILSDPRAEAQVDSSGLRCAHQGTSRASRWALCCKRYGRGGFYPACVPTWSSSVGPVGHRTRASVGQPDAR